jgi:methyl-accepting chemotaxis protein
VEPPQQTTARSRAASRWLAIVLVAPGAAAGGSGHFHPDRRSTREQVARSVGDTVQSVAQSLDAADATNRELVQQTVKSFQRYFDSAMQLDEGSGELQAATARPSTSDYSSVDKFASENRWHRLLARKGE